MDRKILIALIVIIIILILFYYKYSQQENFEPENFVPVQEFDPNKPYKSGVHREEIQDKLMTAEKKVWSMSQTPEYYDMKNAGYSGSDTSQNHFAKPVVDYQYQLLNTALDESIMRNQKKWADDVGVHSKTSIIVDDMDEAVALSTRNGRGITTFRSDVPPVHSNSLVVHEMGPYEAGENATRLSI